MKVQHFTELNVYQASFALQQELFTISKSFPREEMYSLTDQVRRSSRSFGANIAEAWQKRRYEAHFISKLTDADAELAETHHWISTAFHCDYLCQDSHDRLLVDLRNTGAKLGKMINTAPQWTIR